MAKLRNAKKLELGPAEVFLYVLPRASGSLGYPSGVYFESVRPGDGFDFNGNELDYNGNDVSVTLSAPDSDHPEGTVEVVDTDITVYSDGPSVDEFIAMIETDSSAAFLVTAARDVDEDGTSTVSGGSVTLSGGSHTIAGGVTITSVGYLGENLMYQVVTETAPKTGAQTGNVPLGKVVIGGSVLLTLPFKEITPENIAKGVPSSRVTYNSDHSRVRIDYKVAVGEDLRDTRSTRMLIKKIKGGFISPLTKDWIVIPNVGPAEGEVNFPFQPTQQRVIETKWYAWPDDDTGRWAFTGDEFP